MLIVIGIFIGVLCGIAISTGLNKNTFGEGGWPLIIIGSVVFVVWIIIAVLITGLN